MPCACGHETANAEVDHQKHITRLVCAACGKATAWRKFAVDAIALWRKSKTK